MVLCACGVQQRVAIFHTYIHIHTRTERFLYRIDERHLEILCVGGGEEGGGRGKRCLFLLLWRESLPLRGERCLISCRK